MLFRLKMVAKIALSLGAIACAGVSSVLDLLTRQRGAAMNRIVRGHGVANRNPGSALLDFGLVMFAFAHAEFDPVSLRQTVAHMQEGGRRVGL